MCVSLNGQKSENFFIVKKRYFHPFLYRWHNNKETQALCNRGWLKAIGVASACASETSCNSFKTPAIQSYIDMFR